MSSQGLQLLEDFNKMDDQVESLYNLPLEASQNLQKYIPQSSKKLIIDNGPSLTRNQALPSKKDNQLYAQ